MQGLTRHDGTHRTTRKFVVCAESVTDAFTRSTGFRRVLIGAVGAGGNLYFNDIYTNRVWNMVREDLKTHNAEKHSKNAKI
jgi:hypothetical protein